MNRCDAEYSGKKIYTSVFIYKERCIGLHSNSFVSQSLEMKSCKSYTKTHINMLPNDTSFHQISKYWPSRLLTYFIFLKKCIHVLPISQFTHKFSENLLFHCKITKTAARLSQSVETICLPYTLLAIYISPHVS